VDVGGDPGLGRGGGWLNFAPDLADVGFVVPGVSEGAPSDLHGGLDAIAVSDGRGEEVGELCDFGEV
jgi:hypothetical protein